MNMTKSLKKETAEEKQSMRLEDRMESRLEDKDGRCEIGKTGTESRDWRELKRMELRNWESGSLRK